LSVGGFRRRALGRYVTRRVEFYQRMENLHVYRVVTDDFHKGYQYPGI